MKRFLSKSFFISATTVFLLFSHTLSYALAAPYGGNMGMQQNMMGDMPILPNGKVYVPLVGEMTPEEVNKMMQEVDSFVGSLSPKERDEFMNFAEVTNLRTWWLSMTPTISVWTVRSRSA